VLLEYPLSGTQQFPSTDIQFVIQNLCSLNYGTKRVAGHKFSDWKNSGEKLLLTLTNPSTSETLFIKKQY
jgi:hypothetical protein